MKGGTKQLLKKAHQCGPPPSPSLSLVLPLGKFFKDGQTFSFLLSRLCIFETFVTLQYIK